MSNLVIYQEDKRDLPELAFIRDIPSQTKIRDIKDSYELSKGFGKVWIAVITAMGIKGELDQFTKDDIKGMILMRFKNLSLNEIDYAFKLERYGILGDRIEHYQLFDSSYVSKVLDKYVEWKKNMRIEHQIHNKLPEHKISEEEALKLRNSAIRTAWEHAQTYFGLKEGYVFIYEELMKSGFLNDDLEFKRKIHKDAIELLEFECKEKKPLNREEKMKFNEILANLKTPKYPAVVLKCKELSILDFFRKVKKDKKKLKEFKTKYEIS